MNKNIEDFLASHAYARTTIRTYLNVLERLLAEYDPTSMTAIDLVKFVQKEEWGNSRQCVALAASQKYIGWKYGQTHPALQAKIKRVVGKPQRALDGKAALELLASFDTYTAKGARDLAMCALAFDTGLRASELCRLLLSNTDIEHRTLQVIVKGGQWAAAVYSEPTAEYIRHWLLYRKTTNGPGYLFTNIFNGRGLSNKGLGNIVKHWGEKIGIKLSPHDLRRSFATLATELMGAPERVLMEGGRWHNSQMIQRYTRTLKLEAMRKYLPVDGLTGQ